MEGIGLELEGLEGVDRKLELALVVQVALPRSHDNYKE